MTEADGVESSSVESREEAEKVNDAERATDSEERALFLISSHHI